MKKIEMYEANDGRAYKTPQEAEKADAKIRMKQLAKSVMTESINTSYIVERVWVESVFTFLVISQQNIWRIARELYRLRKIHNKFKEADDIPF